MGADTSTDGGGGMRGLLNGFKNMVDRAEIRIKNLMLSPQKRDDDEVSPNNVVSSALSGSLKKSNTQFNTPK